jgi:hypothetical protein
MGVDPARLGGDKFVVCLRRGRNIIGLEEYPVGDLEQSCRRLQLDIERLSPALVNIDAGGFGVAVYDRLRGLGYGQQLRKVDFGGRPDNPDKFKNKRAEMYSALRDWLMDEPCAIALPPKLADRLQSELAVVKPKWINNSQLIMIPKE